MNEPRLDSVQSRWDTKLGNWALWVASGGGTGKSSILDFGSVRHWSDILRPQPLVGEALDTDRLLYKLADDSHEHYMAVRAWYVWTGTQAERCLSLGVPYDTWRKRVIESRYRLEELAILRRAAATRPPPAHIPALNT